ncbi:MAG: ribosome-associated translation inhibitor RaiA [Clostridia bacterium]|nr:ribosome-associated translation inhibitor RaiA [Clostridia bacterium]
MKIEIVQRNYAAKEKLTDLIDKKVQKFEKYLGDSASAKVVLSKSGSQERYKMEISAKSRNTFVRSEVESDNMYANLDLCLAKLERQLVRIAGKNKDSNKVAIDPASLIFFDEVPEVEPAKIVKHKEFELDRLSDEQAVEQIELLDNDFYIYKDMETGNVNVLYRRTDGDYGLIKTK